MDLTALDYQSLRVIILSGEISCKAITEKYLQQIDKGAQLNAFISVLNERALRQAEKVDEKSAAKAGKLAGMVLAIKDNIMMQDLPATCGSKMLENFVSPYDATVVKKLEAEDAIIIGKTNMDEFAMGSSNETSAFGAVKNPVDETRVPGGSSGGSAAAVAGNLCTCSLGSDTGGSIRQPSSMCGVVGLKPTYGRISRFGLVAFASSLDQIGPIARSVTDAALLLEVIAGHDPMDTTSANVPVASYSAALGKNIKSLKIGIAEEYVNEGVQREIRDTISSCTDIFRASGAQVVPVSLPHTEYAIATYYVLANAEVSSNLSRYDGVRYGYRHESGGDLEDYYLQTRTTGFGAEVRRRIMLGTFVLSAGYYDAYYRKAQQARTLLKQDFDRAFRSVDCILTPTSPTSAFKLGEKMDDPLQMYLSDIFTVSINLAGLPAMSVPCGQDAQGLPIGLQLIGKAFDESTILNVAAFLENSPELKQSYKK